MHSLDAQTRKSVLSEPIGSSEPDFEDKPAVAAPPMEPDAVREMVADRTLPSVDSSQHQLPGGNESSPRTSTDSATAEGLYQPEPERPPPSLPLPMLPPTELDLTLELESIIDPSNPEIEKVQKRASNVMKLAHENEKLKAELRAMSDRLEAAERKRTEIAERARQRIAKQKSSAAQKVEAERLHAENDEVKEAETIK